MRLKLNKENIEAYKYAIKNNKRVVILFILGLLYVIGEMMFLLRDVDLTQIPMLIGFIVYLLPMGFIVLVALIYAFSLIVKFLGSFFLIEKKEISHSGFHSGTVFTDELSKDTIINDEGEKK